MAEFNVDLTEMDDFSDVNLDDASEYQDQTDPAPLAPGNYEFRVEEGGRKVNKDGEPVDDNGYPQIVLNKLTVVNPVEEGREPRTIYPFQNYSLKPVEYGNRKGSVPVVDLLRGFDDTLTFNSGREALQLLAAQISNGGTFRASVNWIAKDSEAIREAIDANGGDLSNMDEEEKKELFKTTIFRGQKKFPKDGNGGYVPEVVGPSGNTLSAKVNITRIFPSSKTVKKMGQFGKK